MQDFTYFLPIIIYCLLIVVLIICIIFGIKLIKIVDKVDRIADNVEHKVNSLNGLFEIVDKATYKVNGLFDRTISFFTKMVEKVIAFKNRGKDEDEYE